MENPWLYNWKKNRPGYVTLEEGQEIEAVQDKDMTSVRIEDKTDYFF